MIFKIIFYIPLVCLTFLSSNESTTDEHIDTKNQSTQRYTNYYPHNKRDWNMTVSGSYLYWMIGTHTTFANVFSTTDERAVGNFKQYVFSESMNEIISGNPLYRSGFRVSAAIFNKKYEGWELGGEYQQINYKDCVLNCPRYFIPENWVFWEVDSFEAKFPIKTNINNLTAKVNIGLPNMFGIHDHSTDDIFGDRVTFLINAIEETFSYESALIGFKNKGIVHQSRYVNLGLNFGLELDWFNNSICMNGGNTFIHLGYTFEDG